MTKKRSFVNNLLFNHKKQPLINNPNLDCEEIFILLPLEEQKKAVVSRKGSKCLFTGVLCQQNFCCSCITWGLTKMKDLNI